MRRCEMKINSNEWLEYIVTIKPGFMYDVKSILDQIKDKNRNFEYIIEKALTQSPFSEYIIGLTPINFKMCLVKILELYKSGVISRFINFALIRKKGSNVMLVRIELDRKDINVLITKPEIINIIEKYNVMDEISEIRTILVEKQ